MKKIYLISKIIQFIIHWFVYDHSKQKNTINEDFCRWYSILRGKNLNQPNYFQFLDILVFFPAFRNLFYSRIRNESKIKARLLALIARPQPLLDIDSSNAGGGLYIQHGYATIISAKKIGNNCWINQNVTLGYTNETDAPILGDNVRVGAGAKVLGKITVGNNVIIGANCVVVKNVPANCTVVGNPARIIRMNGERANIQL